MIQTLIRILLQNLFFEKKKILKLTVSYRCWGYYYLTFISYPCLSERGELKKMSRNLWIITRQILMLTMWGVGGGEKVASEWIWWHRYYRCVFFSDVWCHFLLNLNELKTTVECVTVSFAVKYLLMMMRLYQD